MTPSEKLRAAELLRDAAYSLYMEGCIDREHQPEYEDLAAKLEAEARGSPP